MLMLLHIIIGKCHICSSEQFKEKCQDTSKHKQWTEGQHLFSFLPWVLLSSTTHRISKMLSF